MIFSIFKTYKDIKKGIASPTGLGQEMLLDVIKVPIIFITISGIFGLAVFFAFGWTSFLGGPWGFFRFAFFFLLIPFTILEIVLWSLFNKAKQMVQKAKDRVGERINSINVQPK